MLLLPQLPGEQKPARIKSLLKRLFNDTPNEDFLEGLPEESANKVLATFAQSKEQIATLYEKALVAFHDKTYKKEDMMADLENTFKDSECAQEISQRVGSFIQKSIDRLRKGYSQNLKITQLAFIHRLQEKRTVPIHRSTHTNTPEIAALIKIAMIANRCAQLKTDLMIAVMYLIGHETIDSVEHYAKPTSLKEDINFFYELLLKPDHFDNTLNKELETSLFHQGILPVEINSILNELRSNYRHLFEQNPLLEKNLQTLKAPELDLDYCILEFNDFLSHSFAYPTTSLSEACENIVLEQEMVSSNGQYTLQPSNREKIIKTIAKQYDTEKKALTSIDLLTIIHLNDPTVNEFIRSRRADIDQLCVTLGLKKSLIIQGKLTPGLSLVDLEKEARVLPPILLSSSSQSFVTQANNSPTVSDVSTNASPHMSTGTDTSTPIALSASVSPNTSTGTGISTSTPTVPSQRTTSSSSLAVKLRMIRH